MSQLPDLQPDGGEAEHQGHATAPLSQAALWPALIRCSTAVCTGALTTISAMITVPTHDLRAV